MQNLLIFAALLVLIVSSSLSQTTISGTVLGYNGKPMPMAHVHIDGAMNDTTYDRVPVDADGTFKITTTRGGLFTLVFTGVGHSLMDKRVFVEQPTSFVVHAKLKPFEYVDNFDSVEVAYDFDEVPLGKRVKMQKLAEGPYMAEIQTDKSELKYRLMKIVKSGRGVNGTMSDSYEYVRGGYYSSLVKTKDGKAIIIFDPQKLFRSANEEEFVFADSACFSARYDAIMKQFSTMNQRVFESFGRHQAAGKDFKTFSYDWSEGLRLIRQQIDKETSPTLRDVRVLNCISLPWLKVGENDSLYLRDQMSRIPSTSKGFEAGLLLPMALNRFHPMGTKFIDKILEEHPDEVVKANLLYMLCQEAKQKNDDVTFRKNYDLLTAKYPNTFWGKWAKEKMNPAITIKVGAKVPAFTVASLDEPGTNFSPESFKGKFVLLDFWAVWCKPCVGEMETLHKAYQRFRSRNFEMLSLSLDQSAEVVQNFRTGKWTMPWHNAFLSGGFNNDMIKKFEIFGIPRPILVDESGTIVAMEGELRGDNLEKTLERVLK